MTGKFPPFRLFIMLLFWYNLLRKEAFFMTDLEALKEAFSEKQFAKEPLAEAIMHYLGKQNPEASRQILKLFDANISRNIDTLIKEVNEE